jgi:enoyl-CoA hydratase/carnithine racemase
VNHAAVYSPTEAVDAGYLDEVTGPDDVVDVALDRARDLADRLNPVAFRATRVNARGATARLIADTLDADLANFSIST